MFETFPLSPALSNYSQHLAFYDVVLTGQSFLYNQVRRMVGAALAVATGRMDLQASTTINHPSSGTESYKLVLCFTETREI